MHLAFAAIENYFSISHVVQSLIKIAFRWEFFYGLPLDFRVMLHIIIRSEFIVIIDFMDALKLIEFN